MALFGMSQITMGRHATMATDVSMSLEGLLGRLALEMKADMLREAVPVLVQA
jgi:hypothetical protein